jgi:YrbI family 3-deoxy-D-manno-octulosonate 8-phosphate phosphatase
MTDNKTLILEDGKEAVFCNRADGLAICKIKELGIPQIILSTEENRVVEARAKKLNIEVIYGVRDKKSTLIDFCKKKNYNLKSVLYIGNDINDLEVMKLVGYPIAPQDAYKEIKKIAKIIINVKGGNGVIRKLYEMIIK